jgi:hypothetical protein
LAGWDCGLWELCCDVRNFQFKPLLLFAVYAIVLGGGWYVRNWLWTGNPVYPFAYEIFGGRGWTAQMAAEYTRDQAALDLALASDWLWLPWRFAMAPLNIWSTQWTSCRVCRCGRSSMCVTLPITVWAGRFDVKALLVTSIIGPRCSHLGARCCLQAQTAGRFAS